MAPIDQAIGNWKVILAARTAFRRLKETVIALAAVEPPMPLPPARPPVGLVAAELEQGLTGAADLAVAGAGDTGDHRQRDPMDHPRSAGR